LTREAVWENRAYSGYTAYVKHKKEELIFEDALGDEWARDIDVVEVPLGERPLFYLGIIAALAGTAILGQIFFLGIGRGAWYAKRAEANLGLRTRIPAPRGIVTDRFGKTLALNRSASAAVLDVNNFLRDKNAQAETLRAIEDVLHISADEVWSAIGDLQNDVAQSDVVLSNELTQSQLVALKAMHAGALTVADSFVRAYENGTAFSSVLGYVGYPRALDLQNDPDLWSRDSIGKAGVEAYYDGSLRGTPGVSVTLKDAKGKPLGEKKKSDPAIGQGLALTIDGEFQKYFFARLGDGLRSLGRTAGVGIAIDPRNGQVLALVNFPAFDNNVFSASGQNEERRRLLSSPLHPLFNRAVSGLYSPGSTIKPLVGVAALAENIIDPRRTIFSPGYLDIPNPYDPEHPTRYMDWRYQGDVNLASAIAQSSDVYFYEVGGGAGNIQGLGITRLNAWWQKFHLGTALGIDLPGEGKGFLPTSDWKEKQTGRPWLLGDTYNVSIGQGDLLLTPIQLLSYIGAIANGGKIWKPFLNASGTPQALVDFGSLGPEISEAQKGMLAAVRSPLGTAHTLADLPFSIGAKTGSAQVQNNTQENAFFVGYAPALAEDSSFNKSSAAKSAAKPADNPQITVLVLIEHSREGSLNAVPIAKDVLNWYYEHRIK